MWRTIPLLKMLGRMVFYCIAVNILGYLLHHTVGFRAITSSIPESILALLLYEAEIIAFDTVCISIISGLAMALVTAICFRQIHRPTFYRFAMLTVSLIFIVSHFGPYLHEAVLHFWRVTQGVRAFYLVVMLQLVLLAYASQIVAGKYLRDSVSQLATASQPVTD